MSRTGAGKLAVVAALVLLAPCGAPPDAQPLRYAGEEPAGSLPRLSVAGAVCFEADSGQHALTFTCSLSSPPAAPVTFRCETFDGTATSAGNDYLPASRDLVIPAGQTGTTFEVTVLGDSLLEGNESFEVRITSVENALSDGVPAVGTLLNDERPRFEALPTGIPDYMPGTLPPCWGYADGDGLPDLALYLNTGSTFAEMPGFRALLGDGNYHGGAWCDYDRDGDMDLVLMPYGGDTLANSGVQLFQNTPSGFVDVAPGMGMNIAGHGETPVWADFDADGWPDLFLPFYAHVPPSRSFLFLNQRDGTFVDFTDSAGVGLAGLTIYDRPEGACAADWDGDGALDLYCAGHLFHNDGGARFHDIAAQVGLPARFDEGAQFVDFDDDGDLDLYLRTGTGPTLYRNADGVLVDASSVLGLGLVGWSWGDRWSDLDLDGDQDLLCFLPDGGKRLLLANGDGTFAADTSLAPLGLIGTLSAFADFEGDGDPDVVVGDYSKRFARNRLDLVPRVTTPFVKVRLEDSLGRLTLQGATVRLRSLDDPRHPVQTRIVDGGSGYLGQDEYTITFGGVGSGAFDLEASLPGQPGQRVVVGPAENPLLGGIRPGGSPPCTYVIRPDHTVVVESSPAPPASRRPPPGSAASRTPRAGCWLEPPHPSPARLSTLLAFSLPSPGAATVTVYDVGGRRVRSLPGGRHEAGRGRVEWNLRDDRGQPVRAGLYFVHLALEGRTLGTTRLVVLP